VCSGRERDRTTRHQGTPILHGMYMQHVGQRERGEGTQAADNQRRRDHKREKRRQNTHNTLIQHTYAQPISAVASNAPPPHSLNCARRLDRGPGFMHSSQGTCATTEGRKEAKHAQHPDTAHTRPTDLRRGFKFAPHTLLQLREALRPRSGRHALAAGHRKRGRGPQKKKKNEKKSV
jgi:hypothetical protein